MPVLDSVLDALRSSCPGWLKAHLKEVLGLPQTRLHSDWQILAPIGPVYRPHVVIDVGAHKGWFFHCWLDWCPQALVHAFEPYPPSVDAVRSNYGADQRVTLVQMALGDAAGEQDLNVLQDSLVSNSLLVPRRPAWEEVQYQTGSIKTERVSVTTLDAYAAAREISSVYLLKIDVQGYEMQVLRGAYQLLPGIDYILVESGIRPLYENAPRFSDVFQHLTERGFHLIGMQAWHRGNHTLVEADMLFRRDDLMTPVDTSLVRITERLG
jgi:FkbM family methyltransferase